MKEMRVSAKSDVGQVRNQNEDSFWTFSKGDQALLLVADGMGGSVGGKIASTTAVDVFTERFGRGLPEDVPAALGESMTEAHRRIRGKGEIDGRNINMGTTCTVAVIRTLENSATVTFTHIGDSKLYHLRGENIVQRSEDHTMLKRMLDAGALRPEDAADYIHRNVIYKSLGGAEKLDLDPVQFFDLEPGDALRLCSDGLSNDVPPEEMRRVLRGSKQLDEAARYLVNLANSRGGDDNITVVVSEFMELKRDPGIHLPELPGQEKLKNGTPGKPLVIGILLFLLLVLSGLLVVLLRQDIARKGGSGVAHLRKSVETGKRPSANVENRKSGEVKPTGNTGGEKKIGGLSTETGKKQVPPKSDMTSKKKEYKQ